MRAGQLRHQIHIQHTASEKDAWGQPKPSAWADYVRVWADVRHQSGAESIRADKDTSVVRVSIRIRWRTDITAGMRVLHGGAVYDIEAVLQGATREYVDLVARRVT